MTAKEGLDGSGRHAIYDQKDNVGTQDVGAHTSIKSKQAQVRVVWYGGKVLLIALMLLGQFSSQWGKKTKCC